MDSSVLVVQKFSAMESLSFERTYKRCSSSMDRVPATVSIAIPLKVTLVLGLCPLLFGGSPSRVMMLSAWDSWSISLSAPSAAAP